MVMTLVAGQVRITLISQLMKGISSVLLKLLKYFNDVTISTYFEFPRLAVFSVIFTLDLNYTESVIVALSASPGISLKNFHRLPDVSE